MAVAAAGPNASRGCRSYCGIGPYCLLLATPLPHLAMKAITVLEATAEDAEVSTVPASLGPYVQYYPPQKYMYIR